MALNCTARAFVAAQVRTLKATGVYSNRTSALFQSIATPKALSLRQHRRFTPAIVASAADTEVAAGKHTAPH